MTELEKYRSMIDKIDNNIIKLLNERYSICIKVGEYKKKNNIPVLSSSREADIIDRLSANEQYRGMVSSLWPHIMAFSRSLQ